MTYHNHHDVTNAPLSREGWLNDVGREYFRPKPPAYWLAAQELQGRKAKTAAIIWNRNYHGVRKMIIWDQAPDEDWIAHGYLDP